MPDRDDRGEDLDMADEKQLKETTFEKAPSRKEWTRFSRGRPASSAGAARDPRGK
jgi:hypothetical protein